MIIRDDDQTGCQVSNKATKLSICARPEFTAVPRHAEASIPTLSSQAAAATTIADTSAIIVQNAASSVAIANGPHLEQYIGQVIVQRHPIA